ncbi:MAG: hypothetical protein K0R82_1294 [Flavipsychrobacter sp.]|jgi:hypothetical protein|nr:hypothetical protein [Flavipsychrobacter sp.]
MKTPAQYFVFALCVLLFACGTPSPFPLSFPSSQSADDRIVGNWKMVEDTNKNNFYEITRRDTVDKFYYHVRFFNRGGTNPTYEANIFFTDFDPWLKDQGKIKFINVPYWIDVEGEGDKMGWDNPGYFLVRILEADKDFTKLTTATVNHPALSKFNRAIQLENFMRTHINDPAIYSDTVHFYKVDQTTAQLRKPR